MSNLFDRDVEALLERSSLAVSMAMDIPPGNFTERRAQHTALAQVDATVALVRAVQDLARVIKDAQRINNRPTLLR